MRRTRALSERLQRLEAELADLRRQLGEEVRTRRLVVEDPDHATRIKADWSGLMVSAGGQRGVLVSAADDPSGSGVYLVGDDGDICGAVSVRAEGPELELFDPSRRGPDGDYAGLILFPGGICKRSAD